MPKSSRWICRDCARICVCRAALAKEWCACGHYLLADPIEISALAFSPSRSTGAKRPSSSRLRA